MIRRFYLGTTSGTPTPGAQSFVFPNATDGLAWSTEASRFLVTSCPFQIARLYLAVAVAPGAGQGWTVAMRKNGADSPLAFTISDSAVNGQASGSVVYKLGDQFSLAVTPIGTPAAPTLMRWFFEIQADQSFPLFGGTSTNLSTSAARYLPLAASGNVWDTALADSAAPVPIAGTLRNLFVNILGAATPGSYQCGVYKNGSLSALAVTLSTLLSDVDAVDQVPVAAGDTVAFGVVPSGSPTARNARWCAEFVPASRGHFFFSYAQATPPSSTVTQYDQPLGKGNGSWVATESSRQLLVPAGYQIAGIQALLGTAPGTGKSWAIAARLNAATAVSASIADAAVVGAGAGAHALTADADLLALSAVPAGTPAAMTGGLHASIDLVGPASGVYSRKVPLDPTEPGLPASYEDKGTVRLENKRVVPRVEQHADLAMIIPNLDDADAGYVAALGQNVTVARPYGTPSDQQRYRLRVKTTTSRTLAWASGVYVPVGAHTLPTATTGGGAIDEYVLTANADGTITVVAV